MKENKEIKFEILKTIKVLSKFGNYTKEINLVSWKGKDPKIDIRTWNEDHTVPGKGITLSYDELALLLKEINKYDDIDDVMNPNLY